MEEPRTTANQSNQSYGWVVAAIIIIGGFFLLRAYTQAGVDDYNRCYNRVYQSNVKTQQSLVDAGYDKSDVTLGTFDSYADGVNNCNKMRPPDIFIFVTGVKAK